MHIEFVPGGARMLKPCLQKNHLLKTQMAGSIVLQNETASFAWFLIGNHNVVLCDASPVHGVPSTLSSTRAELFGIAALNEFLFIP
jgi:hypothetical protein